MDAPVRVSDSVEAEGVERVLDYPTPRATMEEVQTLIAMVDELLRRVDAAADSDLGRLRSRTQRALAAASAAVNRRAAAQVRGERDVREGGASASAYLRERPWAAFGVAALFVLVIGLWAGRSAMEWGRRSSRTGGEA